MHPMFKWILVCAITATATRAGTRYFARGAAAFAQLGSTLNGHAIAEANDLPGTRRHPLTGIEFVLIRPGEYIRGAASSDPRAERDEMPGHRVQVTRPFYLAVTEVTQDQWRRIMQSSPSRNERGPNWPVENVSLDDVREFCRRTSLRLPSEAEWEYCAGAAEADSGALDSRAWIRTNSNGSTQPVGLLAGNAFGAKDMLGNVAEWTSSIYDPAEYSRCVDGVVDPLGPPSGDRYAIRGGSFQSSAPRVTARDSRAPGDSDSKIGFRVALDP